MNKKAFSEILKLAMPNYLPSKEYIATKRGGSWYMCNTIVWYTIGLNDQQISDALVHIQELIEPYETLYEHLGYHPIRRPSEFKKELMAFWNKHIIN